MVWDFFCIKKKFVSILVWNVAVQGSLFWHKKREGFQTSICSMKIWNGKIVTDVQWLYLIFVLFWFLILYWYYSFSIHIRYPNELHTKTSLLIGQVMCTELWYAFCVFLISILTKYTLSLELGRYFLDHSLTLNMINRYTDRYLGLYWIFI